MLTKEVVVPKGKIWELKRISYSGYSIPPDFYCHKVGSGYFAVKDSRELKHGQILYSGTYKFSIYDLDNRENDGRLVTNRHRTAKLKFIEEAY